MPSTAVSSTALQRQAARGGTDARARADASVPPPPGGIPLPSLHTPLRDVVAALQARGDAAAKCRLFTEYAYCAAQQRSARDLLRMAEWRESQLAAATTDRERADAARSLHGVDQGLQMAEIGEGAEHCRDVVVPSSDERLRDLRDAALAGHVPSMSLYARGVGFTGRLRQLPQLRAYRGEAEGFAIAAARAGDLESLFALASAYDPDGASGSLLGQAVAQDAGKALSYYLQLRELYADDARPEAGFARDYLDQRIAVLTETAAPGLRATAQRAARERLARWRRPALSARVHVAGVSGPASENMMRGACAPDGEQADGEFFLTLPDGTLAAPRDATMDTAR